MCLTSVGIGQDPSDLEEFDNRFEGTVALPVSSLPLLNVVSFTAYFEDFAHHENQQLTVGFNLEGADSVVIQSKETRGDVIYRMKSKPFEVEEGWNEFKPWSVDEVLSELYLTSQDIGVIIHREEEDKLFFPAYVFHSEQPDSIQEYIFQFIPGETLRKVKFKLYKGTYEESTFSESSEVFVRDFKQQKKYGGERFSLRMEWEKMNLDSEWKGWLTLVMVARSKITNEELTAHFSFYHQPRFH